MIRELRGRLSGQFLWGSDYPFFTPGRCLSELEALDLPAEVMTAVLHDNAARVLPLAEVHDDRRVVGRRPCPCGPRGPRTRRRTRAATASVAYTRSMRMPLSLANVPAR